MMEAGRGERAGGAAALVPVPAASRHALPYHRRERGQLPSPGYRVPRHCSVGSIGMRRSLSLVLLLVDDEEQPEFVEELALARWWRSRASLRSRSGSRQLARERDVAGLAPSPVHD
jgi:hypothetical protein